MGKFYLGGKKREGTDSEEFHDAVHVDAGPVECVVCGVRFGQGKLGGAMNVCIECLCYTCEEHKYRHPNCENGR